MPTPKSFQQMKTLSKSVLAEKIGTCTQCVACYANIYPPSGSTCLSLFLMYKKKTDKIISITMKIMLTIYIRCYMSPQSNHIMKHLKRKKQCQFVPSDFVKEQEKPYMQMHKMSYTLHLDIKTNGTTATTEKYKLVHNPSNATFIYRNTLTSANTGNRHTKTNTCAFHIGLV